MAGLVVVIRDMAVVMIFAAFWFLLGAVVGMAAMPVPTGP